MARVGLGPAAGEQDCVSDSSALLKPAMHTQAFGELNYDVQFLQVSPKTKYQFSCEWQRDNWGYEQVPAPPSLALCAPTVSPHCRPHPLCLLVQWEKCLHRYKSMTHLLSRNTVQFLGNYTRKIARKVRAAQSLR